jgi:hypothetical protein
LRIPATLRRPGFLDRIGTTRYSAQPQGDATVGLREKLNENPGFTTAATAVIIVGALIFVGMSFMRGGSDSAMTNQTWFSVDDGATYFAADRSNLPPFDHEGKQAVRAWLFTCDGGKNIFVGYLERYTPAAKKQLEEIRSKSGGMMPMEVEARMGVEIKKPGTGTWVLQTDPRSAAIIDVKCPDGSTDTLELVPDP